MGGCYDGLPAEAIISCPSDETPRMCGTKLLAAGVGFAGLVGWTAGALVKMGAVLSGAETLGALAAVALGASGVAAIVGGCAAIAFAAACVATYMREPYEPALLTRSRMDLNAPEVYRGSGSYA